MGSRRFVAGLFRLALVVLAIIFITGYFKRRGPSIPRVTVQKQAPPATDSLGPGDLRIYNTDSTVDLVLQGDKILGGLSPKTVAKVKSELDNSASGDTSGLGGSIAKIVKQSVAGAIGTHAVFPLSEIDDIRYQNDQIVIDWKNGGKHDLFGSTNVNGNKTSKTFRKEDAERFIAAVRARKKQGAF
ncbi:MAG: hypothetical protein ACREPM_16530 [Gemmatimonadaceae bacterium]